MQLIAVDIGNSSIKVAAERSPTDDRWSTYSTIRDTEPIEIGLTSERALWVVCSVNRPKQRELAAWVQQNRPADRWYLIEEPDIGLISNIESRTQVGHDRMLAAWMAIQLNDGFGPVVVIDSGTAVTVDLVDENCCFRGGTIFLGAAATLKTLSAATDVLPDLSDRKYLELLGELSDDVAGNSVVGESTFSAIVKGVYHSQIGGIMHIVEAYRDVVPNALDVYATGGGIADLQAGLPREWNFVPDLVLRGAKQIGRKLMAADGL